MKKILIAAAALAAMVGCNKNIIETPGAEAGYGYISLGVVAELEVLATKAVTAVDGLDLSGYSITLTNTGTGAEVWSGKYETVADDESKWKVPAGTYTVTVQNKTDIEAYPAGEMGFVQVKGTSDPVEVTAGSTQEANVICNPINSKVACIYTENFAAVFGTDAEVILDPSGRNLKMGMTAYSAEQSYASEAYFPANNVVSWNLKASLSDGTVKNYTNYFTTQANKFSVIKFDVSSSNGILNVTVTVNDKITEVVPVDGTVDPLA